ncbi:MAG: acyltransferase [Bacteroidota bacterium]|nr:acyltransferase [Bacteroidota bacterium]
MNYIKGFDGLRALSIIMVFYTHLGFLDDVSDPVLSLRLSMLCSGTTGVNIFFVLSGFLITRILLKEKSQTGRISFRNFYIRRFIRLLPPLVLFYAALVVLISFGFLGPQWVGLTLSVFYVYNFVPHRYYSGELGHMWSLSVEEQYYAFWPVIVAFFKRYIPVFVAVIIILCILAKIYIPTLSVHHNGKVYPLVTYSYLDRWFLPAVAPIMIGAVFSYFEFNSEEKFRSLFSGKYVFLLSGLLLFFIPGFIPLAAFDFAYEIQLLQMCGIVILLIWIFFNQGSLLTGFLELKPLAYTGKISYGLYVYHGLFIRTGRGDLFIQKYPLNVFLTVTVAVLSYEFYEKKILKWKRKFSSAR